MVKLEYSMVLGAFLIGAIMAESRQLLKIERLIEPVRDLFSAIFFVAIGLMIDPRVLLDYAWPIAVITLAVVLGKMLSCGMGHSSPAMMDALRCVLAWGFHRLASFPSSSLPWA